MIADDLAELAVPIDELSPLPGNPRRGDVDAIARSLSAFGQRKPLVARRDGVVTSGNHTLAAARQLGWSEVAVVWTDDDDATAAAWALADNRTAELGGYDERALVAMIDEVALHDPELVDATGWDDASIRQLVQRISAADVSALLADEAEPDPFSVYDRDEIVAEAMRHYRENGFPFRRLSLLECKQQINQLAATPSDRLLNTTTAYHVADTYHPHRFAGYAETHRSPLNSFADDKQLLRAFRLAMEYHGGLINDSTLFGMLMLVGNTQACANFRPGFALRLYREFAADGATVLDTSTGYGGRLVGFIASAAGRYVGIDPSTQTHAGNETLARDLAAGKRVQLINLPAEDVDAELIAGSCDFAFTSPPYFTKEHYADEDTQSFKRYPEAEDWRRLFLVPMMRLQYAALKPGACALVNIADVELRNTPIPLEGWTRDAATTAGFDLLDVRRFALPGGFGRGEQKKAGVDAFEPVFVFRKAP